MTFDMIILALAIASVFAVQLARGAHGWDAPVDGGALSALRRRRDQLLRALKDIEYERDAGMISMEEHDRLAVDLKRQALDVLRDLDRLRALRRDRALAGLSAGTSDSSRRHIEAIVAERKEQRS